MFCWSLTFATFTTLDMLFDYYQCILFGVISRLVLQEIDGIRIPPLCLQYLASDQMVGCSKPSVRTFCKTLYSK